MAVAAAAARGQKGAAPGQWRDAGLDSSLKGDAAAASMPRQTRWSVSAN